MDNPTKEAAIHNRNFARTGIGVSFQKPAHAVVVGESIIKGRSGEISRYFMALECLEKPHPQLLFEELIRLKDEYFTETLFAPKQPILMVEALKRLEGLTRYDQKDAFICQNLWPSFTRFDLVSGIQVKDSPDSDSMHQDLEALMNDRLSHPDSGAVMHGSDGEEIPRLTWPSDFPVDMSRRGVRQGMESASEAIWHAVMGFELSRSPASYEADDDEWEHKPGRCGY